MYVYVVEQGCYSDRGIIGVYATPEAAMADNPERKRKGSRVGGWRPCRDSEPGHAWTNGRADDNAMGITRYEVQGASREPTP